jgi:hypothetical protein
MSAATVSDVEAGLTSTSVARTTTADTVVTPQEAAEQTSTPVSTDGTNTNTTGTGTGTTADNGERIS